MCGFVYVHKWQTFSRLVESFSSFITMMTQKNNNAASMAVDAFFAHISLSLRIGGCAVRCGTYMLQIQCVYDDDICLR